MVNHVLYATDKNYVELCAVSLDSLLQNCAASGGISVHIIESDLKDRRGDLERVAKHYGASIDFIPIADISSRLKDAGIPPYRGGYSPYARFFISDYISGGRILYMDCDTQVTGDVSGLFSIDMEGCPMGAVADQSSSYVNILIGHRKHDLYFNSGVILFDAGKCRDEDAPEKFLDAVKTIDLSNTFLGADQEIMNVAYAGRIKKLPVRYNMMFTTRFFDAASVYAVSSKGEDDYYSKDELREAGKNPLIVHFAGGGIYQPWRPEGVYFTDAEESSWFDAYGKLYPGDGRYDVSALSQLHKSNNRRRRFFAFAGRMPLLYSFLKGRFRFLKLVRKLIRSRR